MDLGFEQRVVIVTGSSRGIGKAAATLFAAEGARVAVTYRTDREKAEAVVAAIEQAGGEAMAVALDLASVESIQAAVAAVLERWGRIDVLVNNAVQWSARRAAEAPLFEELAASEWQTMLRTNIEGAYAAIQAVLPAMRARRWGRIVTLSSAVAVDGGVGAATYAAAKAALHGLTRSLAKELAPAEILVNVVMPAFTLTERYAALPAAQLETLAKASPLGRVILAEEVVPHIVFLCSARNTAVTGEILRTSGGA